jgi:hypothetical protein
MRDDVGVRKARDLAVGDVFRLHVYGEVLSAVAVAGGKRIRVKIALEGQGRRANCGALTREETRKLGLEFTDTGHILEFLCALGARFTCTIGTMMGTMRITPPSRLIQFSERKFALIEN